jgi:hypothetical protein
MFKMMFLILATAGLGANADVGFRNGNKLDAHYVSGRIHVDCAMTGPSGPSSVWTNCEAEILNPSEADYFVGPQGVVADSLEITALHEDKSTRTKTDSYDAEKGRSSGRFNLWISTVFQRPLLDMGMNKVHYILKLKGSVVSEGDFEAIVAKAGDLECRRTGYYYSQSSNDCMTGYSFCSQYFYENNYCQ